MEYEIGRKSKFPFAFGKKINDVKNVDFEYTEEASFGVCQNCGHQLSKRQTFRIVKLISIDKGKHFVGISDKNHTLKIGLKSIPKQLLKG